MIRVDIFYIFLGLFIGFLIIYITNPSPNILLKYPTIDNINDTIYVDDNDKCYRYFAKKIKCPVSNIT